MLQRCVAYHKHLHQELQDDRKQQADAELRRVVEAHCLRGGLVRVLQQLHAELAQCGGGGAGGRWLVEEGLVLQQASLWRWDAVLMCTPQCAP